MSLPYHPAANARTMLDYGSPAVSAARLPATQPYRRPDAQEQD